MPSRHRPGWDVGLDRVTRADYTSHVRAWRWHLQSLWLKDAAPLPGRDPGRLRLTMERYWRQGRIGNAKKAAHWNKPRWMADGEA
jgi:hypothetical protein